MMVDCGMKTQQYMLTLSDNMAYDDPLADRYDLLLLIVNYLCEMHNQKKGKKPMGDRATIMHK